MKIFNITQSTSPYVTLPLENIIMHDKDIKDDVLVLYQHDNAIIIGNNQNAREEINRKYVQDNDIKLARRMSGGGAVYHDLGNINFSFITDYDKKNNNSYAKFLEPIIAFLQSLGLDAKFHGRNDLEVNGYKVSGNAQYVSNGRIVSHGTILFNVDLTKLGNALNPSRIKFESKGIKSVRARVTNLYDLLKEKITAKQFINKLITFFVENFNGELLEIPMKKYEKELKELSAEVSSEEWIYNRAANFTFTNSNKFSGGILHVKGIIEQGIIKKLVFEGDFLSKKNVKEIEPLFNDLQFNEKNVQSVLDKIDFEEYFGTLEKSEIIDLIFG